MEHRLLYGGDYNPEQWLDRPDILEKDIAYLKLTHCNTVTLGVFSWAALEPEEGIFAFDWLGDMIDRLYRNGISTILATPSGARPRWLAGKYPEVLRTDARRVKQLFGTRHNHCFTSPVYREKISLLDRKLSERFGRHPGVILWHISNELGGECHCPLCQDAFRAWLRQRYDHDIDKLNRCWWTAFWSHTYRSFDEIESPSPIGEDQLQGLNLDWKRFVTDQTASFMRCEIEAVRAHSDLPVTANFMYYFKGLDYFTLAKDLDLVSWDSYPTWNKKSLIETARENALWHDMMRSLKRRPFLLMESCPSSTNWQGVSKLKKPGILEAQMLQAIAHGADGSMYFQIRQSRGGPEKFHGAVIDHYGGADTRVMREAAAVGRKLALLGELEGTVTESRAAILYDWGSIWAMEDSQGPRNDGLHFKNLLLHFYHACRDNALDVDLLHEDAALEDMLRYRILILPMAYQFRPGFAEKVRIFTERGGILVTTFWSGIAGETDLCFEGPVPHGLTDVLGLRSAEIDGLYDWEENRLVPAGPESLCEAGSVYSGTYTCRYLCDLVQLSGAEPVLVYEKDFYSGMPGLTVNTFGKGEAWYLASFAERSLYRDLLSHIMAKHGITPLAGGPVPPGLEITSRIRRNGRETERYLIFQNFSDEPAALPPLTGEYEELLGTYKAKLPPAGTVIVKEVGTERQTQNSRHSIADTE